MIDNMISDKDRVKLLQEMVLRYQEEVEQLHKEMAELYAQIEKQKDRIQELEDMRRMH